MAILMMLILPIHEHATCFHLFVSSLISFFSVCNFLSTGLLPPWLGLFLGTLFFFLLYQMGFFSWFLFLIFHCWCKNAFTFWILTLCLQFCQIHLLGWNFFGGVYRIFYVHYHVICKQWQFCFLLSSLDAFYFYFLSDCCG